MVQKYSGYLFHNNINLGTHLLSIGAVKSIRKLQCQCMRAWGKVKLRTCLPLAKVNMSGVCRNYNPFCIKTTINDNVVVSFVQGQFTCWFNLHSIQSHFNSNW